MAHQYPADAGAFEVAAHHDGVFALHVVGIGDEMGNAQEFVLLLVQRHESHGPGIVDLRESRDELVGEFLARREEAEPDVLERQLGDELAVEMLVGGPDRADEDALAALGVGPAFPLVGLRPDGEARIGPSISTSLGSMLMRASRATSPVSSASRR